MPVMLAEASPTQGPPVDFYAGVVATVMVLLFAKFVTHRRLGQDDKWKWLVKVDRRPWHTACVVTAWSSLMISLRVLALLPDGSIEVGARWIVLFLVAFAGTIFALDVVSLDIPRGDADGSDPAPPEESKADDGPERNGRAGEYAGQSPDELPTEPE